MNPSPRMMEWFRADPWPRMRRVLLGGPAVLTSGSLVIATSFVTHPSSAARFYAAVGGFVLVAGGALFTMIAMQRILREELYLALRTDGVMVRSAGGETLIGWDDLESARWDPARRELVLECAGRPAITIGRPFARIAGPELVERILRTKRKIAMNLFP